MKPNPPEQLSFSWCQRWRNRRTSYRPAREVINPAHFDAQPIDESVAKSFIVQHHYSGSYPAAVFRAGLFRKRPFNTAELVGVAVFSVPCNNHVVPYYTGEPANNGIEIGRFALEDSVEANGETFFLRRAFRLLREVKPQYQTVIAYADPMPRVNQFNEVIKPGHIGTIYHAHNATYHGRSRKRTIFMTKSGDVVNERALSKLKHNDVGKHYALKQLEEKTGNRIGITEYPEEFIQRLLQTGSLRRISHPGNHVFSWHLK